MTARLVCERCGNPATHHTIDGADSKLICSRYQGSPSQRCYAITPAKNTSPPWVIFADKGKSVAVMPAGRPGDVANVELVPDGVVAEVVKSVNNGRMSVDVALDVFRFHAARAG